MSDVVRVSRMELDFISQELQIEYTDGTWIHFYMSEIDSESSDMKAELATDNLSISATSPQIAERVQTLTGSLMLVAEVDRYEYGRIEPEPEPEPEPVDPE